MKRMGMLLMLVLLAFSVPLAFAETTNIDGGLVVGTRAQQASATTEPGIGDLYVYDDCEIDGDLDVAGQVTLLDVMGKCDSYDNLIAKSSVAISGIDGITLTTATAASGVFYVLPANISQPAETPRNIIFYIDDATVTATCLIEGLDARGNLQHETMTITQANTSTSTFAAWSWFYGATITAVSGYGATATHHLVIGTGDKIGLMGNIAATTNVYAAKVRTSTTWADETTSVTANATYDTWTHSDVPDGADDFMIFYRCGTE